jgi:hypothetical protein
MLAIGKSLGLRGQAISTRLNYADVVEEAGEIVGWTRAAATARWR